MGGFNRNGKQMTKREMQNNIGDQASNAVKMVQGLATVVQQQFRNMDLKVSSLSSASIMREDGNEICKTSVAYIDFVGTLDGVPFEGGEGIGLCVDMQVHQFLPDFQAALYGMKAGETKTFDLKFPENYQAKELVGKVTQFEVYVRKVLNEISSPVAQKVEAILKARAEKKAVEQAAKETETQKLQVVQTEPAGV